MEDLGGALDELTVLLQLGAHAHVAELVANGDDLAVHSRNTDYSTTIRVNNE